MLLCDTTKRIISKPVSFICVLHTCFIVAPQRRHVIRIVCRTVELESCSKRRRIKPPPPPSSSTSEDLESLDSWLMEAPLTQRYSYNGVTTPKPKFLQFFSRRESGKNLTKQQVPKKLQTNANPRMKKSQSQKAGADKFIQYNLMGSLSVPCTGVQVYKRLGLTAGTRRQKRFLKTRKSSNKKPVQELHPDTRSRLTQAITPVLQTVCTAFAGAKHWR